MYIISDIVFLYANSLSSLYSLPIFVYKFACWLCILIMTLNILFVLLKLFFPFLYLVLPARIIFVSNQ